MSQQWPLEKPHRLLFEEKKKSHLSTWKYTHSLFLRRGLAHIYSVSYLRSPYECCCKPQKPWPFKRANWGGCRLKPTLISTLTAQRGQVRRRASALRLPPQIKPLSDEAATSHNDAVINFISFRFSFSFGKVGEA